MRGLHRSAMPCLRRSAMRCLPSFCLLAMLAFLPQGRALRQKPQKLALILCVFTFQKYFCCFLGVFLGFGYAPKASRGLFSGFGSAPEGFSACFRARECSHDFPDTFSTCGSAPKDFPKRFHLSKVLLLLPRRVFGLRARSQNLARLVFGLWECSIATRCTALSFGRLPNAHTGIVRAWRGNHTKSFHQEDEPWQRRQLQR